MGYFLAWPGHLYGLIMGSAWGWFANRVLGFCAYFLAVVGLDRSLARIRWLGDWDRRAVVLLFSVYPTNFARIHLIDLHYGISYGAFFLATWLFLADLEKPRFLARVGALASFALAFTMNSTIVFFALVPLAGVLAGRSRGWSWLRIARAAAMRADVGLLPVAIWWAKKEFFKPWGYYAKGYNEITDQGVRAAFGTAWSRFFSYFHDTWWLQTKQSFAAAPRETAFFLVSGALVAGVALRARGHSRDRPSGRPTWRLPVAMLGMGAFAGWLAVFPYAIVEKYPGLTPTKGSGFAILIPLGAALLVAGALNLAWLVADLAAQRWVGARIPARARTALFAAVLGLFVAMDNRAFIWLKGDAFKQRALMLSLREMPEVRAGSTFFIYDYIPELNALGRWIELYEYTGLMKMAFGDEGRLGLAYGTSIPDAGAFTHRYNLETYRRAKVQYVIDLSDRGLRASFWRLVAVELIAPWRIERELLERVQVRARVPAATEIPG